MKLTWTCYWLDENDLRIVCGIIEAAIWYTNAEKVEIQPPSSAS
jgi:hypothetical protein